MPKLLRNILIGLAVAVLVGLMLISAFGRQGITFVEDKLGIVTMYVGKIFAGIGNFVDERVEPFFNVLSYKEHNEALMRENSALREEVIALTLTRKEIAELEDLENALNIIRPSNERKVVGANVIGKDPGNWFNYFVIDVGYESGVTKNSTVINGQGLVGLVYEVGATWSKVVAIVDQKSSVAFEMVKSKGDFDGIVSGSKNFELICEFYDPNATFEIGDSLMTSGIGIYPQGIMIGKIVSILEDAGDLSKKAVVSPVVDFHKIKKVLVVPYEERK